MHIQNNNLREKDHHIINIILLNFFLVACSSSSEVSNQEAKTWHPPQLISNGSHFSPADGPPPEPIPFCDIYLTSDAFVYGSIVSISFIQEPFVFVRADGKPISDQELEGLTEDACVGISSALKIDIKIEEYESFYGLIPENVISIYISSKSSSYMEPTPIPFISKKPEESYASLDSPLVRWTKNGIVINCGDDIQCPLSEGDRLGMFLFFKNDHNVWYPTFPSLLWASNVPWNDPANEIAKYGNLQWIFSNLFRKQTIEEIRENIRTCSDNQSSYNVSGRTLSDRLWQETVPTCITYSIVDR